MRLHLRPLLAAALLGGAPLSAQPRGAAALGGLLDGLGTSARVLVIGAHPDDEPTALLAWLARGKHARVAYLSLTRGESGTNLVGGETCDALGVVRTAESIQARDVDGAEQYFTRAYDFGYSKSAREVYDRWGKLEGPDAVLSDIVTVIRAFRPHVVVSVYEGSAADVNGQHWLAGRLARDAFAASFDSASRVGMGRRWRPNTMYRLLRAEEPDTGAVLRVNVGEYAPVLGRTFAELAAESRARQRTQGAPAPGSLGAEWMRLKVMVAPTTDGPRSFFDGIDTTLARLRPASPVPTLASALDSLPNAIAAARAAYRPDDPSSAVAALAALTRLAARAAALAGVTGRGATYDADVARSLEDVWHRAHDALVIATGVVAEAVADRETVAHASSADSSDTMKVSVTVHARGRVPVRVDLASMPGLRDARLVRFDTLRPDSAWHATLVAVPRVVTQPWWRLVPRTGDLYSSNIDGRSEREMEGAPEGGPLRVEVRLNVLGTDMVVGAPVVYRPPLPAKVAEIPVASLPGLTVRFDRANEYVRAGVPFARPVRVTVTSSYATSRDVVVRLEVPPGFTADSVERHVTVPGGATGVLGFMLKSAAPKAGNFTLKASVDAGHGDVFAWGAGVVGGDHVPPSRIYFPAWLNLVGVDVALPRNAYVAYVATGSDAVPLMLNQLGVAIAQLDPSQLAMPSTDLSRYSAIVLGPRAFETNTALFSAVPRLYDFARRGGTVVVQQGQLAVAGPGVLPFPIALGASPVNVTVEDSPVQLVDSTAAVLRVPNRITDRDFAGWVQDRAAFVPSTFDPHWASPLAVADPDEPLARGALLVAKVGLGRYVYTTLSLHKQLAAANPGAARIFANLLNANR